jgi:phage terminase small subunit
VDVLQAPRGEVLLPAARERLADLEGRVKLRSKADKEFSKQMGKGLQPQTLEKLSRPVRPHKRRELTTQEWTFVHEFVSGDGHVTLQEAVLRAGYTAKNAKKKAEELTDPDVNPHIVAAIQKVRAEMAEKYGTTYERHMRDLQVIRDQALAAGAYGAAVQAEYRRGQALGTIYIDRKEIRHGTIDSMSKEEVERKLAEIKKLYGNGSPIIDVTPEQVRGTLDDPEPSEALPNSKSAEEASPAAVEEPSDADQARDRPVPKAKGKPPKLPYYPR